MCRTGCNHATLSLTFSLTVILLQACTTTRVVETSWDEETVDVLNRTCENQCKATVYTPDPVEVEANRLSVRNGILGIGRDPGGQLMYRVEMNSVTRIAITRSRHGQGAIEGLGIGVASGALLGALVGSIAWEPCDETGFLACFMHPETRGAAATLGGVAGGTVGGLLGLMIGVIGGKKDINVYEYQPIVRYPTGSISRDDVRGLIDETFVVHDDHEAPRHVSE